MTQDELLQKIVMGEYRLGFHGSSKPVKAFTHEGLGRGPDPNTTLGIYFSPTPDFAAEHAFNASELGEGPDVRIYVVAIPCVNPYRDLSREQYYGRDREGQVLFTRLHYAELRESLMGLGHDIVEFQAERLFSVCLNPDDTHIVACLSYAQLCDLQNSGFPMTDSLALFMRLSETTDSSALIEYTAPECPDFDISP